MSYDVCMRTTLDLPDVLIDEARAVLGFKSKTDTVVYALKEVVRRGHVQGLKTLFGKVHIELDLNKSRGRTAAKAVRTKA
jgi:hypothetical protein